MPMIKHTPGPWEWTPEPEDDGWDDRGPNLRSVEQAKVWDAYWAVPGRSVTDPDCPNSPMVLDAWGHDAWGINVGDADKALIAAAPAFALAWAHLSPDLRQFVFDELPEWVGEAIKRVTQSTD